MSAAATTMKRALVAAVAVLVLALAFAPRGLAQTCADDILDEWADKGRIEGSYPASCYDSALAKMGPDMRYYSDAPEAIQEARDRDVREQNARGTAGRGPNDPGSGSGASANGDNEGFLSRFLNLGPSAADDLPLPLLILAIVALLLMAAGAAGLVSRHLQNRRLRTADGPPADGPSSA